MKSVLTAGLIAALSFLAFLPAQSSQASARRVDPAERLFSVLKRSGLKVSSPFAGAKIYEAFEVTCLAVASSDETLEISCDLASRPGGSEINSFHLVGSQARRLLELLKSAGTEDGESGASSAFIRCGQYSYPNVDVTYDCQVATPFGKRH